MSSAPCGNATQTVLRQAVCKLAVAWLFLVLAYGALFLADDALRDSDARTLLAAALFFGGFLGGGALAGSKVGPMGWLWLAAGLLGLAIGFLIQTKLSLPWPLIGMILGAHVGLLAGAAVERQKRLSESIR